MDLQSKLTKRACEIVRSLCSEREGWEYGGRLSFGNAMTVFSVTRPDNNKDQMKVKVMWKFGEIIIERNGHEVKREEYG